MQVDSPRVQVHDVTYETEEEVLDIISFFIKTSAAKRDLRVTINRVPPRRPPSLAPQGFAASQQL